MTSIDRPHLTMQQRYMEILSAAEAHNAATIYVGAIDWHVLQQCAPSSARGNMYDGEKIVIHRRTFKLKPPSKSPSGTLDLTGDEPSFEP